MAETLTPTPEQIAPQETVESLAQLALQGAISTAGRGNFTLAEDTEAELRALFDADPAEEPLPLSAHGLQCDWSGKKHVYLDTYFKIVEQ